MHAPDAIDVVIPAYNAARYLEQAARSVLAQTLPPARLIIVDDGSTDGTAALMRRLAGQDARVRCVHLPANRGLPAARNAGIAASDAPLIAFLDADDLWHPEKLAQQAALLAAAPARVGFVYCAHDCIDANGEPAPWAPVARPALRGNLFKALLYRCYLIAGSASAALIKRVYLDAAGPFDESLTHAEDLDLWLRLSRLCDADFCPEVLVSLRAHNQSLTRRPDPARGERNVVQYARIFDRWYPEHNKHNRLIALIRLQIGLLCARNITRPGEVRRIIGRLRAHDIPVLRDACASMFGYLGSDSWTMAYLLYRSPMRVINYLFRKRF